MLSRLINFDPIKFLDIDTSTLSPEEVEETRDFLKANIGEYILLQFSNLLTEEQLKQGVESGEKIIETLRTFIPDLDQRILQKIENFKKDYKNS